jgi:hypothetical protein
MKTVLCMVILTKLMVVVEDVAFDVTEGGTWLGFFFGRGSDLGACRGHSSSNDNHLAKCGLSLRLKPHP